MTAWPEIAELVAGAPYPVEVLPADPGRAAAALAGLEITTRSWLGAVVAETGGLVVDHGWLRVRGGGHARLPEVGPPADGRLVVALDVLGGQFAWTAGARPSIAYFGPDRLAWDDLETGYGDWLEAVLTGGLTDFYESLRWPGWQAEVAAVPLDQGISLLPPPFTREGKDLATVSRKPIPLAELVSVHHDMARQLGFA
ncbi:DUF2625 family protein [Asanoa siamensis]|uniref:DUF2625 family protein n=1 Tax=Asanoa siamensis TaxID=926357 RepID=A0ABQ4CQ98_9ACTN|nr:DUF2625 family protein [Asanoa siamensis]GIF73483.1 hypothetical protein Asi02nite_30010 [Asanoa siamensis]